MDTTAVYFALVTLGLIVLLSALVIVPRRLYRRFRHREPETTITIGAAIPMLLLAIGLVLVAVFYPRVGLIIYAILLVSCVLQLSLMPGDQRARVVEAVRRQNNSPIFRSLSFAMYLILGLLAVVLALNLLA